MHFANWTLHCQHFQTPPPGSLHKTEAAAQRQAPDLRVVRSWVRTRFGSQVLVLHLHTRLDTRARLKGLGALPSGTPCCLIGSFANYRTLHCTLHSALCTLHYAHCILHTALCEFCTAHCTLHTALCTLHSAHCTLHIALCTLHSALCTLHSAHCTLHTALCSALCSAQHSALHSETNCH